jgi:site-specific DNA-cytosine methylase
MCKEIDNKKRLTERNDNISFTISSGGRNNGRNLCVLENEQIHPTITQAISRQGCSSEYIKSIETINSIKIKNPKKLIDINQGQRVYSTEGTSVALKGLGGGQGAKTGLYLINNENKKEIKMIYKKLGKIYSNGDVAQANRVYSPKGIITSQRGGTRSLIKTKSIRRLTPIECCRLQGFPDNWNKYGINEKGEKVKISDTQRYKQMGNAVTTNVIKEIAKDIKEIFISKISP